MAISVDRYYQPAAAAYIRGMLREYGKGDLPLVSVPILELNRDDRIKLTGIGTSMGLQIKEFRKAPVPARIQRVLSLIDRFGPQEILDVGTGRGAFLYPFLERFPELPITCNDLLVYRTRFLDRLVEGGQESMQVIPGDFCQMDLPERSFDMVTMMNVLEHMNDPEAGLQQAARIAKRYVLITIPTVEEENPPQKHLMDRMQLEALVEKADCRIINCQCLPHQIIMTAQVSSDSN